jgi:hypothetical protein
MFTKLIPKPYTLYSESGQLMPIILVILFGFSILTTTIAFQLRNEARWTIKEKRSATAFHLAEAGIDRTTWKLNETRAGWDNIIRGIFPPLYDATTSFYVQDKGYYKILISSARVEYDDQVIIQSIGTDKNKKEARGLKTVYSRLHGTEAAITSVGGVTFSGNADVHWGPVMNTKGDVEIDDEYPRKYAGVGYIIDGRDPNGAGVTPDIGPDEGAHSSYQSPNFLPEDLKDWSSNGKREIPNVEIVLSTYAARAKTYITPAGWADRSKALPIGAEYSGYFPGSSGEITFPNGYIDTNSDAVYFIEGDAEFGAQAFIGPLTGTNPSRVVFIVLGDLRLPNVGLSATPYTVCVPTGTWKEYQVIDTINVDEYPADTGFKSNPTTFDVNSGAGSGAGVAVFHGLIYVGKDLNAGSGNKKIVGVVVVKGQVKQQSGTLTLFYSKMVDENIILSGARFESIYWAEFTPGSIDNPNW